MILVAILFANVCLCMVLFEIKQNLQRIAETLEKKS
jgi:hypothetical protein